MVTVLLHRIRSHARVRFLLLALFSGALFAAGVFSPHFGFASKYFTDFFASGFSSTKAYAFFLYAGLSFFLLSISHFLPQFRISRKMLLVVVALAFLVQLGVYVGFAASERLEAFGDATVATGSVFSETKLIHIHNMKAAAAFVGGLFGAASGSYDAGIPFLSSVPAWAIIIFLILFGASAVLFLLVFGEKEREWADYSGACTALYLMTSFSVLKNMVDGGPLSIECLVSALVLFLLIAWSEKSFITIAVRSLPYAAFLFLSYGAIVSLFLPLSAAWDITIPGVMQYAFFALVAALLWNRTLWGTARAGAVFACIAVLFLLRSHSFAYHESRYLLTRVEAGDTVHFLDTDTEKPFAAVYRNEYGAIYSMKSAGRERIMDIVVQEKLNPSFYPVMIPGKSCPSDEPFVVSGEMRGSPHTGLTVRQDDGQVNIMDFSRCAAGNACDYSFAFEMKGCTPNPKKITVDFLASMGFEQFVMSRFSIESPEDYLTRTARTPLPKSGKKAVIVFLESARARYLEDYASSMPFLTSLAARGCSGSSVPVSPTFSAAQSLSLLTGTYGDKSGGLHIIYLDDRNEFKLAFTESITPFYAPQSGVKSLGELIEGNRRDIIHLDDSDGLMRYLPTVVKNELSVLWLLDTESEPYGTLTGNAALAAKIAHADVNIERFYRAVMSAAPDTLFLFVGDHGISEIRNPVIWNDVRALLTEAGIPLDKANLWIDAGVGIRIWMKEPVASSVIEEYERTIRALFAERMPCLYVEDKELRRARHTDLDRTQTGDIMIGAHPGCIISADELPQAYGNVPDSVLQNEKRLLAKRMGNESVHGYYENRTEDMQAMFVMADPYGALSCKGRTVNIVDFAPTILEYLGYGDRGTAQFDGTSLYKRLY